MVGKFFPVDVKTFKLAAKEINFDVFLKLSEDNYAHVFAKTTGVDYQRLAQYISKGTKEFYVRIEDEAYFRDYLQKTPEKMFNDPKVTDSKKVSILLNMAEQNVSELFNVVEVSPDAAQATTKIVKNFIQMMGENPKSLALLLKTACHGDYLFYHSISVAVVSIFIAKAMGQTNPRMLEICGLGGFLHDIGLTLLPKEIVDSPSDFTPIQWREMRTHPKLGIKMLENTANVPDEVRYIVAQHHEEMDGSGYPSGLRGAVIFYPAKVVALADTFCALITKRPFREAYSVDQALGIIEHETGKYDPELVRVIVRIFGQRRKAAA